MKKTTSQKFSKRLAQYGALSVAIAGIPGANAQEQIGYTNIDPDYSGTPDPYYIIDFNNDAIPDFAIYNNSTYYSNNLYNAIYGYVFGSNQLLGNVNSFIYSNPAYSIGPYNVGFIYPFALDNGAVISGGQNTWFNSYNDFDIGINILNYDNCYFGEWCDVQDKYIGVQFKIGANTHYGWARLDVGISGLSWTIKDYAYNMTPNAPILAGQTTSLSIDDNVFSKIKVVALNKSIGLYNLLESANYNIYNMTGQEVLKGTTDSRDFVIETPTLSSGVYVLELTDANSKGVFRKKVVLH